MRVRLDKISNIGLEVGAGVRVGKISKATFVLGVVVDYISDPGIWSGSGIDKTELVGCIFFKVDSPNSETNCDFDRTAIEPGFKFLGVFLYIERIV